MLAIIPVPCCNISMKLFVCIVGGIILAFPCFAWKPDPWSKTDISLEILSQGLLLVDWGQTLDIREREDEGYYEKNSYLGKYPSRGKVNKYFALSCLAHGLITWVLPVKWEVFGFTIHPRRLWQYGFIGVESPCVINNYQIGIRVNY